MNTPAILEHLAAASVEMRYCGLGGKQACSFDSDLRRHAAAEVDADREEALVARYARHLIAGDYSPTRPENFAEAMREVFAEDDAEQHAREILTRLQRAPVEAAEYLSTLVADYWAGQADYVARSIRA